MNRTPTMIKDAYADIDAAQQAVSIEEIFHRAGPVRPLGDAPQTSGVRRRTAVLVGLAAAAAVVAVVVVPYLLRAGADEPVAPTSTVTSTTVPSTTTTTSGETDVDALGGFTATTHIADLGNSGSFQFVEFPGFARNPVTFDGSLFTVLNGLVYRSGDGIDWIEVGSLPSDAAGFLSILRTDREYLLAPGDDRRGWRSTDGKHWDEWSGPTFNHGVTADGIDLDVTYLRPFDRFEIRALLPEDVLARIVTGSRGSYGSSAYFFTDRQAGRSMYDFPRGEIEYEFTDSGATIRVYQWSVECSAPCRRPWSGTRTLIHTGTVSGPSELFNAEGLQAEVSFDGRALLDDVPMFVGLAVTSDGGETYEAVPLGNLAPDVVRYVITPAGTKDHGDAVGGYRSLSFKVVEDEDGYTVFSGRVSGIQAFHSIDGLEWVSVGVAQGLPSSQSDEAETWSVSRGQNGWFAHIGGDYFTSTDGTSWVSAEPPSLPSAGFDPELEEIREVAWGWVAWEWSADRESIRSIRVSREGTSWSDMDSPEGTIKGVVATDVGIWILFSPPEVDTLATVLVRPAP